MPTMGLLPARQKTSEAHFGLPKVEKFHKKQDLSITIREPFNLSVLTHPQLFVDESKTKIICPRDISIISGTHIFASVSFGIPNSGTSLLWILFIGNNYTDKQISFIQCKLFSIVLNHSKVSTFINYPIESLRLLCFLLSEEVLNPSKCRVFCHLSESLFIFNYNVLFFQPIKKFFVLDFFLHQFHKFYNDFTRLHIFVQILFA